MVRIFLLISITGALLSASAFGAAASVNDPIKVPCATASGSSGNIKSQAFNECSSVITRLNANLDQRVKDQVAGLYQGKSFDPSDSGAGCVQGETSTQGTCSSGGSNAFVKPVCSITANIFNKSTQEVDQNHLPESCGERIQIHVSNGASQVSYDLRGQKGSREIAYYAGSYVQAVACYLEQVKKEVINSNSILKVSDSCKSMAQDVSGLSTNYGTVTKAVNEKIKSDLAAQKNIADIWNCEKKWSETSVGDGKEIGPLRQSAQHLCAARAALESMFNQLLVCEVFARASNDFLSFYGDLDGFREKLDKSVGAKCNSSCNSSCNSECSGKCKKYAKRGQFGKARSCAKACAGNCGTRCGNSCYKASLVPFLQDQLKRWPNDGSCPL